MIPCRGRWLLSGGGGGWVRPQLAMYVAHRAARGGEASRSRAVPKLVKGLGRRWRSVNYTPQRRRGSTIRRRLAKYHAFAADPKLPATEPGGDAGGYRLPIRAQLERINDLPTRAGRKLITGEIMESWHAGHTLKRDKPSCAVEIDRIASTRLEGGRARHRHGAEHHGGATTREALPRLLRVNEDYDVKCALSSGKVANETGRGSRALPPRKGAGIIPLSKVRG